VTDNGEKLREAFETHEHLAPDPAAVYARVQELARTYKRRRLTAQAAGGAVLGAGLIAGAVNVPSLLPARPGSGVTVVAPGAAPAVTTPAITVPTPEATPSLSPSEQKLQKQWDAYFRAGYGYDDALKLAKIWHSKADVGAVKAEAGRRLLAGQKLPIKPGPETSASASDGVSTREAARVDAFFAAGYDYNDAVKLAKLWKKSDPYQAKIEGGKRLLAGGTLPIRP
jgi:hypothetical protein